MVACYSKPLRKSQTLKAAERLLNVRKINMVYNILSFCIHFQYNFKGYLLPLCHWTCIGKTDVNPLTPEFFKKLSVSKSLSTITWKLSNISHLLFLSIFHPQTFSHLAFTCKINIVGLLSEVGSNDMLTATL